jgi:hypothetical protein
LQATGAKRRLLLLEPVAMDGSCSALVARRRAPAICPIPDSRFPIPDSRFPIPDSRFPIPDPRVPIPESRFPSPESRVPSPESYFEPLKLYTRLVVNNWSECSAPGAISLL